MSSRLTVRSSGALAAAAASLLVGIAGAPAASAATVSTTLNYTCRFPLMRPQPLQLKISADLPTSIPQNTPTGAFSIHATANVNDVAASGLRAVSSATLEGTAVADATITLADGTDLPLGVPTDIPKMTIPSSGAFTTDATGSTPSLKFQKTGTVKINVGDVVLTLTPRLADGTKTGLDTFETECKQDAGQNNLLAAITVTPTATPTPTPVPTATPSPTPTPTPSPTPVAPTPTPTGVNYGYNISGSATLKTLTKGSLPLNGSVAATLNLGTGAFSANISLNPSSANLVALGFLPVAAKVNIVPLTPATGTLAPPNLTANTTVRIKIPTVTVFGLQLAGGSNCQAKNPSAIKLTSPGFDALNGGLLTGTFTISNLTGCGFLNGIVSPLTAGSGNAIALNLTA